MKRWIGALCAISMIGLLVCGCGKEQAATVVRLNEVTHSVFYAPQYVAMALGFFREEGLQVELTNGGGTDKVMTAVAAGQSDIGLAGPESCVYIYQQGKEDCPVVFGQLTKKDGSFLVGREDGPFSWEDLKGKTVIGGRKGGMPEMTLEYVMRQNGLTPGKDVNVDTSIQFNMMAGAFTGGQGDYVTLFEPTATQVEMAGQGYILCSIGEESGEVPYTAYFAARSYVEEHPETVEAFCRGVKKGLDWVYSHSDEEVAQVLAEQFPDTDVSVLTEVTARHRAIDAWNWDLTLSQEALERLETIMTQAGELSRDRWVEFDTLADNSFALAAGK